MQTTRQQRSTMVAVTILCLLFLLYDEHGRSVCGNLDDHAIGNWHSNRHENSTAIYRCAGNGTERRDGSELYHSIRIYRKSTLC